MVNISLLTTQGTSNNPYLENACRFTHVSTLSVSTTNDVKQSVNNDVTLYVYTTTPDFLQLVYNLYTVSVTQSVYIERNGVMHYVNFMNLYNL